MFSVARRGKQLIDQAFIGERLSVRQERGDFVRSGRQADQIEVCTSNQNGTVGGRRQREVTAGQLNPNSSFHLSFNLGFPNAVERAQGRTGSFLMVHGSCVSVGCYAMTDGGIEEIYGLVEAALDSGQTSVPVHAFPFRMTQSDIEDRQDHPEIEFWKALKPAYDLFEKTGEPPAVFACGAAYQIRSAGTPIPEDCEPLRSS